MRQTFHSHRGVGKVYFNRVFNMLRSYARQYRMARQGQFQLGHRSQSALLEDLGYHVLAAADAAEAGARLAENPGVDLLLADVILPGGRSGPDFAETARRRNPALKVLFMSGYSAEVLMQRGDSLARDTPLLPKPFRKTALAKAVREALDDGTEVQGAE